MNPLKNLAGNDVAIFLFQFVLSDNGIHFVVNKEIAADMYPDLDEKIKPLAHICGETLLRYQDLSVSSTIMDGNILPTGEFEVMLSRGLGRHFAEAEKQQLFQDAKKIADLLATVMERRTQEEREGTSVRPSHPPAAQHPQQLKQGLEQLGNTKRLEAELQWLLEGQQVRPGLRQLQPDDLPRGVKASRSYDHRGHCVLFEHDTLGSLGKIVFIELRDGKTLLQAELYKEQESEVSPIIKQKKNVFEQVVTTVNACFDENFPV